MPASLFAVVVLAISCSLHQTSAAPSSAGAASLVKQHSNDLSRMMMPSLRAKRAMLPPAARAPMFEKPMMMEPQAMDMDPALQGLSTSEIYRMLEILDMIETKKTEKLTMKDMDTLKYLLDVYQQ
ncbi:hypothetical protein TCAL_09339 [Tigriopus californicus]|uniref:Uncharacterized protein n=1 Tax=Tigriopus californicus TaxID=6832 RepID=A0A553NTP4_TIGCA|nr:uncharacterized protein LOC131883392 [Tigriopus californicus]TRY68805.1 hypothetical protein TCAL_09339 [Tigriopus californicus]|eukprot:TCALIF_09339-PA protein Name:"Protein of unknown function" AED:0.00 eAED:0.00 QI:311/1/1/1/0.5/0.66/3/650/124